MGVDLVKSFGVGEWFRVFRKFWSEVFLIFVLGLRVGVIGFWRLLFLWVYNSVFGGGFGIVFEY